MTALFSDVDDIWSNDILLDIFELAKLTGDKRLDLREDVDEERRIDAMCSSSGLRVSFRKSSSEAADAERFRRGFCFMPTSTRSIDFGE